MTVLKFGASRAQDWALPGLVRALTFLLFVAACPPLLMAQSDSKAHALWIASNDAEACPRNRFTWYRKEVDLTAIPADNTLHVAAASNAHVWVNGTIVRRKVTRYAEPLITTEKIDVRGLLHKGRNVVVVLQHSWGPIVTFQRTGCKQAAIYVASSWIHSDTTWKMKAAEEFATNDRQITGLTNKRGEEGDHRIRYAQFLLGALVPPEAIFRSGYDDGAWMHAVLAPTNLWPAMPQDVETPGQRELPVRPQLLLAQGKVDEVHIVANQPVAIETAMLQGQYRPAGKQAVSVDPTRAPTPLTISGHAGETRYVTFDFGKPVHGYPFLTMNAQGDAPTVDFAYGELNRSPLTGRFLVDPNGWIDSEAVVGKGYIDRYYARPGLQHVELPDERTARWWTIHCHFARDGRVILNDYGIVSSQYPVTVQGSFSSGDKRLDQIVHLSLEHAIVSMSDTYVDTPGREDGMWLEDARLRAQLSAQWFGDVRLRQLLLRLAAESQGADGRLHPFPPSNYPANATADWAAEWVAALYDDYMWTGETTRVSRYWPQVVKWWTGVLANVDETGLWRDSKVFADIRTGVHPTKNQSSGTASAQLVQRLGLSIVMADAIGDHRSAEAWTKAHAQMLAAFRRDHIVQQSGEAPLHVDDVADPGREVKRGYSQAAQAMAIQGGLLTEDEARADLDYSYRAPDGSPAPEVNRWNNPTYLYRALDALTLSGYADRAVAHLLERFAPYLPGDPRNPNPPLLQGPWGGPLPEYWISREDLSLPVDTPSPAQPLAPTGSHGWNAVALVWLHDSLLGVRILKPGGGMLAVRPRTGGLPFVEGTTMTPKGPVHIAWQPAKLHLSVELPPGVEAVVHLPTDLVSLGASQLYVSTGCRAMSSDTYSCGPGKQTFSARANHPVPLITHRR